MKPELSTASHLDGAIECLGSAVLIPLDVTDEDAEAGRIVHGYLARAREVGRERALAEVRDEDVRERCAGIDLDALPQGAEAEVAFAWDWRTGKARILGRNLNRAYPPTLPTEFVGTADLVGRAADGAVVVADFKTGLFQRLAAESWQLRSLALFAASLPEAPAEAARTSNLYLGHDGRWHPDRAELDAFDLADVAQALRDLAARIAVARERFERCGLDEAFLQELRVGPWCKYCSSRRLCPAQVVPLRLASTAALEAVAAPSLPAPGERRDRINALSIEEQARLYERLKVVRDFIEDCLGDLRDNARQEPLPLSSGKELREVSWHVTVKSEVAQAELAGLMESLERRGEIRKAPGTQVRVVKARAVKP